MAADTCFGSTLAAAPKENPSADMTGLNTLGLTLCSGANFSMLLSSSASRCCTGEIWNIRAHYDATFELNDLEALSKIPIEKSQLLMVSRLQKGKAVWVWGEDLIGNTNSAEFSLSLFHTIQNHWAVKSVMGWPPGIEAVDYYSFALICFLSIKLAYLVDRLPWSEALYGLLYMFSWE